MLSTMVSNISFAVSSQQPAICEGYVRSEIFSPAHRINGDNLWISEMFLLIYLICSLDMNVLTSTSPYYFFFLVEVLQAYLFSQLLCVTISSSQWTVRFTVWLNNSFAGQAQAHPDYWFPSRESFINNTCLHFFGFFFLFFFFNVPMS